MMCDSGRFGWPNESIGSVGVGGLLGKTTTAAATTTITICRLPDALIDPGNNNNSNFKNAEPTRRRFTDLIRTKRTIFSRHKTSVCSVAPDVMSALPLLIVVSYWLIVLVALISPICVCAQRQQAGGYVAKTATKSTIIAHNQQLARVVVAPASKTSFKKNSNNNNRWLQSTQTNYGQQMTTQITSNGPIQPQTNKLASTAAAAVAAAHRISQSNYATNSRPLARPQRATAASSQQQQQTCALILQRMFVKGCDNDNDNDNQDNVDNENLNSGNLLQPLDGVVVAAAAAPPSTSNCAIEPTGQVERVCITYQDVDQAIEAAKLVRRFDQDDPELVDAIGSIEPPPAQIAKLGELNQQVTKLLAQKFDLSPDEILNGLPLIDMSKTQFWPICPLMVKPIRCDPAGRFRSFTGHCNNLQNPAWGAAQTPFVRFLAPRHPDGIEQDRVSVVAPAASSSGHQLPAPRLITSQVHRDVDRSSNQLSLLVMVWGQMIDHDVALAAPPRDSRGLDFNCCKMAAPKHPNCKPLAIPSNDPLYGRLGQTCMDFKRSLAGLRPNCALGPRAHINTITATIDGNTIYGSTEAVASQLRAYSGGQLKVQDVFGRQAGGGGDFKAAGLKPLLPKQLIRPDLDCFDRQQQARNSNLYCFLAGDERVNEQPTLTVLHTIYVRDHNRVARQLELLNPHWDDDRIYHETRHIEAATIQHLLISEYLPTLIGQHVMQQYNLSQAPPGAYWSGYQAQVTPSISQGFSTAAFRQGHTFIQGQVRLHDPRSHAELGRISLRQLFKRPFHYYQAHRLDQVLAGIVDTPAQTYDPFVSQEIGGHLFQETGEQFGMDLPAINLARAREQGVPGYNAYRQWCGLSKATTFDDLAPDMSNATVQLYRRLYRHVDDIDLWSAGVSERPQPGAQVGPTFACIIGRQFANIKRGDRFWYELGNQPGSFTLDQLAEIKKATQARVLCKNSDNLKMIQRQALKLSHPILNPRVPCDQIADLNLKFWRENPEQPGEFYTESR